MFVKTLNGDLIVVDNEKCKETVIKALDLDEKEIYVQIITEVTDDDLDAGIIAYALFKNRRGMIFIPANPFTGLSMWAERCVNESMMKSYLSAKINTVATFHFANPNFPDLILSDPEFWNDNLLQVSRKCLMRNTNNSIVTHPQFRKHLFNIHPTDVFSLLQNSNPKAQEMLMEWILSSNVSVSLDKLAMCHPSNDLVINYLIDHYSPEQLRNSPTFMENSNPVAMRWKMNYYRNQAHDTDWLGLCSISSDPEIFAYFVERVEILGNTNVFHYNFLANPIAAEFILRCLTASNGQYQQFGQQIKANRKRLSKNSDDSILDFLLQNRKMIYWPNLLLNTNPRAVETCLKWLQSGHYTKCHSVELLTVLDEIETPELIMFLLNECPKLHIPPEIAMVMASKVPDVEVVIV